MVVVLHTFESPYFANPYNTHKCPPTQYLDTHSNLMYLRGIYEQSRCRLKFRIVPSQILSRIGICTLPSRPTMLQLSVYFIPCPAGRAQWPYIIHILAIIIITVTGMWGSGSMALQNTNKTAVWCQWKTLHIIFDLIVFTQSVLLE